jgi:RNA polymerase sigma-70 factor (ECF subfamily)
MSADVMALDIADGQVKGVHSIINPDKLRRIGSLADVRALLKRRS